MDVIRVRRNSRRKNTLYCEYRVPTAGDCASVFKTIRLVARIRWSDE